MIPDAVHQKIVGPYFSETGQVDAPAAEKNRLLFHFSRIVLLDGDLQFKNIPEIQGSDLDYFYLAGSGYIHHLVAQLRKGFLPEFSLNPPASEDYQDALTPAFFKKSWEADSGGTTLFARHYILYGIVYGLSLKTLGSFVAMCIRNKQSC